MNWYPVEFIEGCAVHECLHSWTLALGSSSCLVLSFHVDPSAEFPAFRPHLYLLSEHLQQYAQNLRPSLTCTVRAWLDSVPEATPGGELGKQNCTERKVDRDGWSCHAPHHHPETTHPSGLRNTYWMTIGARLPWLGGGVYVRWLPSDFSMGLNARNGPVCLGIVLVGTIGRKKGPFWVVDILWQAIKQLGTCLQRGLRDPRLIPCSLFVGSQPWSQHLALSHSPRQYAPSLQDQMQWVLWPLTEISKLLILSANLSSV